MTTDIKKLAERLRVAEVGEAFQTEDGSPELQRTELGLDAADALEAMASARAECERQYQVKVGEVIEQMERAEKAEAEVKRLKAALEFYSRKANYEPFHDDPEVPGAIAEPEVLQDRGRIARSALEAKP